MSVWRYATCVSAFIGARRWRTTLWWVVLSCLTRMLEIKLGSYGRTASAVNFFLSHLSGLKNFFLVLIFHLYGFNTEVCRHVHNFLRPTKKEKKNRGGGIMQTFKRRTLLSLAMGWEVPREGDAEDWAVWWTQGSLFSPLVKETSVVPWEVIATDSGFWISISPSLSSFWIFGLLNCILEFFHAYLPGHMVPDSCLFTSKGSLLCSRNVTR